MANVFDVANYILQQHGSMTTMKLQKLVYYCQAWSLVWDGRSLFDEPIEAWDRGPVVRQLFESHRGKRMISSLSLRNDCVLDPLSRGTIDAVLERYGAVPPEVLSNLTHAEAPWREAHEKGNNCEIPLEAMQTYYGNLPLDSEEEGAQMRGSLFYLKTMLRDVNEDTWHEEIDFGPPVGQEVW